MSNNYAQQLKGNEIKERTDGLTPIHMACHTNNSKIVRILLKHGANSNIVNKWYNHTGVTTMHIAATFGNKTVMKLLIQHGFNLDKLINHKMTGDEYRNVNVFLILCMFGHVKCLSYLLQACNNIDFRARTQLGFNGLHFAVMFENLEMVKYLLRNVYKKKQIRQKIFKQTGNSRDGEMSVSQFAFKHINSGSSIALSIVQTLMNYGCSFDNFVDPKASNPSKILSSICVEKDFFKFFGLFKFILLIYLKDDNISNLEEFYASSIIKRDVVENILMEITDEKHGDSVQYEWIYVITTMLNSYIDRNLAMQMAPPTPQQQQWKLYTSNILCTNNHKMIQYNLKSKNILCVHCEQRRERFQFACCKCCQYICQRCATESQRKTSHFEVTKATAEKLVEYLNDKEFDKFIRLTEQYPSTDRIILDVCGSVFFLLTTVLHMVCNNYNKYTYNILWRDTV